MSCSKLPGKLFPTRLRLLVSALVFVAFLAACSTSMPNAFDILQCSGPFARYSSEETLAAHFGTGNVTREEIYIGEGESVDGTVLFGDDPRRRLEITWVDPVRRREIESIRISEPSTAWSTQTGLKVGEDLRSVERINMGPFTMHGYAWDYAGTVADWGDGPLGESIGEGCRLIVRFGADDDPRTRALEGEDVFSSRNAVIQAINPAIREIILIYDESE
ncbi:MAG: hypothetical protein KY459_01820 [Acidobacteria bacterium]|nr:hypothetical protein [Acidobacteriota bacterium]